MPEYTNPAHTSGAYLRNETLTSALVANCTTLGKDTYARQIYVSGGGVVNDLTLTTLASAVVYNGGEIKKLVQSNGGNGTPVCRFPRAASSGTSRPRERSRPGCTAAG